MLRLLKLTMLALLVVIGSVSLSSIPSYAAAASSPAYRFEITDQTIHAGRDVAIGVRLIQIATGQAVTNAVITDPKLLMMMGKTEPMPAPVKALPLDANGNYRFACDVVEPGDWELDLSAQVASEKDPVYGSLKFKVIK